MASRKTLLTVDVVGIYQHETVSLLVTFMLDFDGHSGNVVIQRTEGTQYACCSKCLVDADGLKQTNLQLPNTEFVG